MLFIILCLSLGLLALLALTCWLIFPHGPRWFHRHADLTTELRNDDGFIGVDMHPARLIGHEGVTLTDMRPAGKVKIGTHTLDAVATLGFIGAGSRVRIVRYENAQVYVDQA
ncbi:MAG: hypothetical protein HDR97_05885 [Bacteroides sp.]|nr:hypothetical protein [Bacteroides sp.]